MITSNVPEDESARARLLRKIWTTRGARFEAYRRLSRAGLASRWGVTMASLSLVCLALARGFGLLGVSGETTQLYDFLAAVGAVAILVVSAMEHGKSYGLRADRHHQAALDLGVLYDRATMTTGSPSDAELIEVYDAILNRFTENHEPVDFEMFSVRHPTDFTKTKWDSVRARLLWHCTSQRAWLIIVGVLAAAALLLWWLDT